MSQNTFGQLFRVTTFGESHGPALGVIIDGLPPNLAIDMDKVQKEMARRRPGQSKVTTSRQESDEVEVLAGLFEGKTTGAPLCLVVFNKNAKPKDYEHLREVFRPGHADYSWWKKYGIRDHRGGGRSSGRETAARVAAGAIAKQLLSPLGIEVFAFVTEIGGCQAKSFAKDEIEQNIVRCADPQAALQMVEIIEEARKQGDSVGGVVEVHGQGVPAGLGDPIFGKLDAQLASALMSIGSVKGVEIGAGFRVAKMRGSSVNDQMSENGMTTNNAGGILGGVSTGEEVVLRLAVKPTPSVSVKQETVDKTGSARSITIEGRHDPCIAPRMVPVAEAMVCLVLADLYLRQRALRPDSLE